MPIHSGRLDAGVPRGHRSSPSAGAADTRLFPGPGDAGSLRSCAAGKASAQDLDHMVALPGTDLVVRQQNISHFVTMRQYRSVLEAACDGKIAKVKPAEPGTRRKRSPGAYPGRGSVARLGSTERPPARIEAGGVAPQPHDCPKYLARVPELLPAMQDVLRKALAGPMTDEDYDRASPAFLGMGYHATGARLLGVIYGRRGLQGVVVVMADPRQLFGRLQPLDVNIGRVSIRSPTG